MLHVIEVYVPIHDNRFLLAGLKDLHSYNVIPQGIISSPDHLRLVVKPFPQTLNLRGRSVVSLS